MEKQNMIFSQLITRGITNDEIITAFDSIARGDFVSVQNKRSAYSDIEMPLENNRVMVRSFVLAKILEKAVSYLANSVLILGDPSGYTSSIFKALFKSVTVGALQSSEIEKLRGKINSAKVILFEDLREKFDLIFLDGGIFKDKIRRRATELLNPEGHIIYFSKDSTFEFNPKKMDFFDISVIAEGSGDKETVCKMPLLFPCDVIS